MASYWRKYTHTWLTEKCCTSVYSVAPFKGFSLPIVLGIKSKASFLLDEFSINWVVFSSPKGIGEGVFCLQMICFFFFPSKSLIVPKRKPCDSYFVSSAGMKVVWTEPMSYTWCLLHSISHFVNSVKESGLKPNGFIACPCQSSPEMEGKIHAIMCMPWLAGNHCAISRNGICLLPPQAWSSEYLAVVYWCLSSCHLLTPGPVCSVCFLEQAWLFWV